VRGSPERAANIAAQLANFREKKANAFVARTTSWTLMPKASYKGL
jgi:hypothetical protein